MIFLNIPASNVDCYETFKQKNIKVQTDIYESYESSQTIHNTALTVL